MARARQSVPCPEDRTGTCTLNSDHVCTSLIYPWPIMLASDTHRCEVAHGRIVAVEP